MAYTVLARRYRSQDFDEVVGQEPIARTLQQAIRSNRVAHAYLFCGTRGVGKTSTARIFAKALNAVDGLENRDEIAAAIMRGNDIDVIEIDGASNNSVEQARDLIANSIYRPARCPYKIYIIDEVHMLTPSAFNALLKTMEEPPSHVKFILCTTEPHKVPATIQSRCQRFDFRPIPMPRIVEHLKAVLAAEGVDADERVVAQIARLANGSMRDGLSLLDRLLAAGEKRLTPELLEEMLGLPEHELLERLVDAIANGDAGATLERAARLLNAGTSLDQSLEMLIEHLRTLMILSACGPETELAEVGAGERERFAAQAARFDTASLVHMIALMEQVQRAAKSSPTARALFDAAIVRLALSAQLTDLRSLPTGGSNGTATSPARPAPTEKKTPHVAAADPNSLPAPHREPPSPASPPAARPPADSLVESKPPAARPPGATPDPEVLWEQVADEIRATWPALAVTLDALRLESIDEREALLVLTDEKARSVVQRRLSDVEDCLAKRLGRPVKAMLRVAAGAQSMPHPEPVRHAAVDAAARDAASKIPIVRTAMQLFDARIVAVEELARGSAPAAAESDPDPADTAAGEAVEE